MTRETNTIYKVDTSTGVLSTFATNLPYAAYAVSFDVNNNLWVADTSAYQEYSPNGTLLFTPGIISSSDDFFAVVFNPAGTEFYLGDALSGNVSIYDTSNPGTPKSSFSTQADCHNLVNCLGVSGLSVAGGIPTAAYLSNLVVSRHTESSTVRWTLANRVGVIGFNVYVGGHRANRALIRVHANPAYSYHIPGHAHGRVALHIILANGQEILVPA